MAATEPADDAGATTPLRRFLATSDIEALAQARGEIDPTRFGADDRLEIEAVLHDWDDVQAVANLLLYPELIGADDRLAQVRRAIADERSYVQLAGIAAIVEIERAEFGEDIRFDVVQRLLAVIAADRGVLADRASYSLVTLMHPTDAPEIIERIDHPSATVRRNLVQGLLGLVGPSGVRSLLTEPGFVEPEVQDVVRERLRDDGVDLNRPVDDLRLPLILAYLPGLAEWDG